MSKCKTKLLSLSTAAALVATAALAAGEGDWRVFSEEANGDVYFYDASRVQQTDAVHTIWQRIRYKNSVMAAASYESRLEIDCAAKTQRTLQRTFFTDKSWEEPAMSTDKKKKRKRRIKDGSAAEHLSEILCDQ